MMLRVLSAISVFVVSVISSAAVYHLVAPTSHHPITSYSLGQMFGSMILICVCVLAFVGVYLILRPSRARL